MTTEAQSQAVSNFLAQLDAALVGVPADISGEIVAGIGEELAGLDAAAAFARIEELGDPAFIAAEARAGMPPVAAATVSFAPNGRSDPRWYIVLTALLVAFGGVIVPVIGWIVGMVMMWLSKSWFKWEKWVATLTPVAVAAVAGLIIIFTRSFGGLTVWHTVLLSVFVIPTIVGIWLLWRAFQHPRPVQRDEL